MQLGSDAECEESEESDQEKDEVTPSLRNILEGSSAHYHANTPVLIELLFWWDSQICSYWFP